MVRRPGGHRDGGDSGPVGVGGITGGEFWNAGQSEAGLAVPPWDEPTGGAGGPMRGLNAWGECGGDPGLIPQTVADCFQKFGSDPIALEACLSSIGANQ